MSLSTRDQFAKILSSSEHVLIILPQNPTGDMLGAGYGLAHFIQNTGNQVTIAFKSLDGRKEMYDFLPKPADTRDSLSGSRDFVLTFKTTHNDITGVRSERGEGEVRVFVTPQRGMIDSQDFSFGLAKFPYDAMIAIGGSDQDAFGSLLTEIPDIFYDVPVINIDNKSDNEDFGKINIVNLTASCLSEMITEFCEYIEVESIDEVVAQCFLTGIISATDSFRSKKTTPNDLSRAGMLIERGANQHDIVTHLYKSQPLSLLKLWGKALSKLQVHLDGMIVSTLISTDDFTATAASKHFIPQIIDKIKKNHTTAKFFIIIYEDEILPTPDSPEKPQKKCVALIDAERFGHLPEEVFGAKEENGYYGITFQDGDCNTGREKLANLIKQTITQQ